MEPARALPLRYASRRGDQRLDQIGGHRAPEAGYVVVSGCRSAKRAACAVRTADDVAEVRRVDAGGEPVQHGMERAHRIQRRLAVRDALVDRDKG